MLGFVHIEKAGGTTMRQILRQSFGARHCDAKVWPDEDRFVREQRPDRVLSGDDLRRMRWVYWRLESIAGHPVVPFSDLERACPGIRYYTFLREPLSRCASHYQSISLRDPDTEPFEDWIAKEHYHNVQCRKLAGRQDAEAAIEVLRQRIGFVGCLERFDESLVMLRNWAAHPDLNICYRSKNVASDSSIKKRLLSDPESRALLEEVNREDRKLYRFVQDELYPQQVREYGNTLEADLRDFQTSNAEAVKTSRRELAGRVTRNLAYKPLLSLTCRGTRPAQSPRKRAA